MIFKKNILVSRLVLIFILLNLSQLSFSQKISYEANMSISMSNGFDEKLLDGLEDISYCPKLNADIEVQLNIKVSSKFNGFTGIGFSSYRYKPNNAPRWPTQHNGMGGFRDIGFNENGLVENFFVSVPVGFEANFKN